MTTPPVALGLDSGSVRVGLAATDPTATIAGPVATLPRRPAAALWARVREEARNRGAGRVVVGLPRRLDGSEGDAAAAARALADEAARETGLAVELWDERFSSVAAERALVEAGMRRGRPPRLLLAVSAVLVLLLAAAGATAGYARSQLDAPTPGHDAQVSLDVLPGESLDSLVADLDAHHLVRNAFWFRWYARARGLGSSLRAGRYGLDTGMGASAVVARLAMPPDVETIRVVIPEGMTAEQIAARVQAAGLGVTASAYLAEERAGRFAGSVGGRPPGTPLEGMLFPDTYDVRIGATAADIVAQQLDAFTAKALPLVAAPPRGLTPYQLLVLASIVEREARLPADRPMVAGVLYNRLSRGWDLQVDASVIYGLGVTDRAPTSDELKVDTPYNTYLHRGLPPTPIANPGLASIEAAAHPAPTAYLFYVSDGCGHNHYSTTLAGHDALVQKYLGSPCLR